MVTNTMVYLLDNVSYIIWLQTLWYIYWIMLVILLYVVTNTMLYILDSISFMISFMIVFGNLIISN